ncbi:hypothetical protein MKZ38_008205 [Zalerion maritima]|uniref:Uncharacterized protein n=1 Tax=Zalerion maritima TaxID=339359 RepID=A0AAD5WNR0_9PEZI|nr:hypothetical protein MKZ38_008205 [Zalerion maritima]
MPPPNTPEEGLPEVDGPSRINSPGSSNSPNLDSTTSTPTLNFQALEYVDPVDQELICPICRDPLLDPYTTVCEHTFCLECICKAHAISHDCPTDRTPIHFPTDITKAAKIVRNQLDSLRVRCPYSTEGCNEICSRSQVEDHVTKLCIFAPVDCPDDACTKKVCRRDAARNECLHFTMPCEHCERPVECLSMQRHIDHDCPKSHQPCQHCSLKFPRSALEDHESECDDAMIPCDHAGVGCSVSVKQRELPVHLRSCPYTLLEKLGSLVTEQRDKITQLEKRDREMERRLKSLEFHTMHPSCSEYPRSRAIASSTTADGMGEEAALDEALRSNASTGGVPPPFESMDQYLLALYESAESKMDNLQKSLNDLEGRQTVMLLNETMPIKEQLAEMRSNIGAQGMHVRWLMNLRIQERARNAAASAMSGMGGGMSGLGSDSHGDPEDGRGFGRRLSDSLRENPPRL